MILTKMKKNILLLLFCVVLMQSESGDIYRRYGIHNGNLVKTVYSNWGVVGQPGDKGPRGAWINDNNGYIGDVSLLVGAEVEALDQQGNNITFHSVVTCPVDRPSSTGPEQSNAGLRWGFEPVSGYLNPSQLYVATSTNSNTWPNIWPDEKCNWGGDWCGYFGKDTQYIQQESFYVMNDNNDHEFNYSDKNQWGVAFKPSPISNPSMNGLGLEVKVRGMQWQQILAQDCIFFLYEIKNISDTEYKKVVLGELVGTYIGNVETEADDDWSFFDVNSDLTYTGDFDNNCSNNNPNWVGDVGMVGYAFLESPGNPYDGIDNDGDSESNAPLFGEQNFIDKIINIGDNVIIIDENYNRSKVQINQDTTLISQGREIVVIVGESIFNEGNEIDGSINDNAFNGLDDDLDGLIDENYYLHYRQVRKFYNESTGIEETLFDLINPKAYIDYLSYENNIDGFIDVGLFDLIDERRDDGIDNDNDWNSSVHDVGSDGIANTFDLDGSEGNGIPDAGEPNFDQTDPDESDQIGLTSFDYFVPSGSYPASDDEELWNKLSPGFFDVPESINNGEPTSGEDGDFIFGSGYFPLLPGQTERFSIALIYGENKFDLDRNKDVVQEIYDNDYQFPPPPSKPNLTIVPGDSKAYLYWDRIAETTMDPVLLDYDFQGYKIYRATDPDFNDVRNITNAYGIVESYSPIAQFDLIDDIDSLFYPSYEIFQQSGGLSFNLGNNSGLVHSYIDSNLINGRTYYYAVTAYDEGDPQHTFPSENTKYITVLPTGEIITDNNTGYVTPTSFVQGFEVDDIDIENIGLDIGTGMINCNVVNNEDISGHEYLVEFWDSSNDLVDNNLDGVIDAGDEIIPITSFYNIENLNDIVVEFELMVYDTTYYNLRKNNIIDESFELKYSNNEIVPENLYEINFSSGEIKINISELPNSFQAVFNYYPIYKSPYINGASWDGTLINDDNELDYDDYDGNSLWIEEVLDGEVFDGMRLEFDNDWDIELDSIKWIIDGVEIMDNDILSILDVSVDTLSYPGLKSFASPNNYMIVFDDDLNFEQSSNRLTTRFKVYDITNNYELDFYFQDENSDNQITNEDRLGLIEKYGDVDLYTWNIGFSYFPSQQMIEPDLEFGSGDTLYIYTKKPFRNGDEFILKSYIPEVHYSPDYVDLSNVRVVPNPYIAATSIESSLPPGISSGRGERKIEFQNVPNDAIIKIFNIRGQHIKTLKHDGNIFNGSVSWNLKTDENMDIAYGVYLYVLESPSGSTKGKIAIIK
ncbi:MAG: hypothetical protein CMG66_02525 [Candidatus Marinimicrobia bacterium]|nr:hypothetical protein [Candidatus Neomarinimicrobiota bacterium]|tara:strand:+ start:14965 stop:18750 length:3786 start_codon:yes stop_codon:yes gene_type:complete